MKPRSRWIGDRWRLLLLFFLVSIGIHPSSADKPIQLSNDQIISEILASIQRQRQQQQGVQRPHVTLTFAQSLDGKLAPSNDGDCSTAANYPLSGPESLELTHALRSIHDGILIGGRTLSIDNPRLNNRLWKDALCRQPRPIVLDPSLKHVHKLNGLLRASNPLILCSDHLDPPANDQGNYHVVPCPVLETGKLDLHQALQLLKDDHGIQSIMVEGGAAILKSFLSEGLFDDLCITIAPMWLGPGVGISLDQLLLPMTPKARIQYRQLGNDVILLLCKLL